MDCVVFARCWSPVSLKSVVSEAQYLVFTDLNGPLVRFQNVRSTSAVPRRFGSDCRDG